MDKRLSIFAAAREVPDRIALVEGGRAVTYQDLAEAVRSVHGGPTDDTLVGRADVDTIVRVLAAFEDQRPVRFLHPRWTPREVEQVCARTIHDAPTGTLAVFATSGSEGAPKIVALSSVAFLAAAAASAANFGWVEEDRWQLSIPLAHVGGFSILVRVLAARRAIVVGGPPGADKTTLMSIVPTQLARLLETGFEPGASLRVMLVGGAACPAAHLEEAERRGWPVYTTYGSTECCAQVATERYAAPRVTPRGVGRTLDGLEVWIPTDGEILVRGPSVAPTYLSDSHVPLDADGWLHTGDLGAVDESGVLYIRGRKSDVIVTGGENVMPFEVEEALRAVPGVDDAVVFGVPDDTWGEAVAAAVVAKEAPPQNALDDRVARFKHPKKIALFEMLPTNHVGKIDRAAARDQALSRLRSW